MGEIGKIKCGGISYYHTVTDKPDPTHFERHCHGNFEILYVARGAGRYIVEGAEYPLLPGTLLLTRPNEFHYVCPDTDCVYERFIINFSLHDLYGAAAVLPMLQHSFGKGHGVYFPDLSAENELISLFYGLDKAANDFIGSAAETVLGCEISRLLLRLSLLTPSTILKSEETVVMRVIEYVNENLSRPLSLDALAERFFISKYHLCHLFRSVTGVSVHFYINTKRIARAKQMLSAGSPATEVAYKLGYDNYSSFYRTYCKHTGSSPVRKREN